MGLHDFTIYDLIVRNARIFANREAWISDYRRVNFHEFMHEVNVLSFGLQAGGLKKGDRASSVPYCGTGS
jgi:non-ribosomal peptide synthetase component E (peptide arylation enzyme)